MIRASNLTFEQMCVQQTYLTNASASQYFMLVNFASMQREWVTLLLMQGKGDIKNNPSEVTDYTMQS